VPSVLGLYKALSRLPLGRTLFSVAFARKAPYFRSIRPRFTDVSPHHAALVVADRKAVRNHIGTMHVIAVCNGLEAAMGALAEVTVPPGKRWLPKGMEVEYAAKASSDITCVAHTTPADWDGAPDVPVSVTATRDDGTVVVRGTIHLWVTDRTSPPHL
jgi:acyl-coenzyme A thioesterase PaaI-like protein